MVKVNEEIKSNTVKLVTDDGAKDMSLNDAIALAQQTDEDVIMISSSNGIPVVKIEEISKYLYKEQKKQKENMKKQRQNGTTLKEIRMDYSIEEHDINVKIRNIERLLKENSRVKVSIIYKGRAIKQIKSGLSMMQNIDNKITFEHKIDGTIKIEGNKVIMTVIPIK